MKSVAAIKHQMSADSFSYYYLYWKIMKCDQSMNKWKFIYNVSVQLVDDIPVVKKYTFHFLQLHNSNGIVVPKNENVLLFLFIFCGIFYRNYFTFLGTCNK